MRPDVELHRRQLFGIAYRMLGRIADAEDLVQEAYLRWETYSDWEQVRSPKSWLTTTVTRLCIDELRSARRRREEYVGVSLPEPLVEPHLAGPDREAALSDSLTTAFLIMLETLSPVERAAFLLREGFGFDYSEISEAIGKSEANCRQIIRRSRENVTLRRSRFQVERTAGEALVRNFFAACESGDTSRLMTLLAPEATVYSDGGGRVKAALRPIVGADKVTRFFLGVRRFTTDPVLRFARVNGTIGVLVYIEDSLIQTMSFEIVDDRIDAISIMRNPDKLTHLADLEPGEPGEVVRPD